MSSKVLDVSSINKLTELVSIVEESAWSLSLDFIASHHSAKWILKVWDNQDGPLFSFQAASAILVISKALEGVNSKLPLR
jgi:hypothetical protein